MTAPSPTGAMRAEAISGSGPEGTWQAGRAGSAGPAQYDWEPSARTVVDLASVPCPNHIRELAVSADGERAATVIEEEPDRPRVTVNDETWEGELEKAWHLRFTPDGRAFALVRIDDEWTVMVEGAPWEQRFEFAWNPKLSADGKTIAVQVKQDMKYSLALDGKPWEAQFLSCRDYALSPDGEHAAATVQIEELPEADIFKFREGTWGVAVDGEPWGTKLINVYAPVFSEDGRHVAVEARTDTAEYTVAQDGELWSSRFGCVWEPRYRRGTDIVVPVRKQGAWVLAENGTPIWKRGYVQLWRQVVSPGGERIAAVVATGYGRWTVAVDDVPWAVSYADMVDEPVFSADGMRVAAAVKSDDHWGVAVDGKPWADTFDMVWSPIFSPCGARVAARVQRGGRQLLAVDGRTWKQSFDRLWDPLFSPDGQRVLVRGLDGGKVVRQVVPITEIRGGTHA